MRFKSEKIVVDARGHKRQNIPVVHIYIIIYLLPI